MIKFDIRAHIDAMEGLYELQKVLDREQDRQLEAVARVRKTWKGTTAETFQLSYETMLLDGIYEEALQQVRGMYNTMAYALPEMEYLKNKCENFHTYLSGEPYERWNLGAYKTPSSQLMSDSAAISTMCTYLENISASNHGACDALSDLMDACGGLIDFSEEEAVLRRAREKADRVLILRDELNSYARRMEALDDELSRNYAKWVDTDILNKIATPERINSMLVGDETAIAVFEQLSADGTFSPEALEYLAGIYATASKQEKLSWEAAAFQAAGFLYNRTESLTAAEQEILDWVLAQTDLAGIYENGSTEQKLARAEQLIGKECMTELERQFLVSSLNSFASLGDNESLQVIMQKLLEGSIEHRQTVNGEKIFYTVDVKESELEYLKGLAQEYGATNLLNYLSSLENMNCISLETYNPDECSFNILSEVDKYGKCKFVVYVQTEKIKEDEQNDPEYQFVSGGMVELYFQSDMGVSQLSREEIITYHENAETYAAWERWFDQDKKDAYIYNQHVANAYQQIQLEEAAADIQKYDMKEYLNYLYGDAPDADSPRIEEWNAKCEEALVKVEEWKAKGVDMDAVQAYYYYQQNVEELKQAEAYAEKDPVGATFLSFADKFIGNISEGIYEATHYMSGEALNYNSTYYMPGKKADITRNTVANNLAEDIGGMGGEFARQSFWIGVATGDIVVELAVDAAVGAGVGATVSTLGTAAKATGSVVTAGVHVLNGADNVGDAWRMADNLDDSFDTIKSFNRIDDAVDTTKDVDVVEGSTTIDIGYMKNNADPMRDVLGSGSVSNPEEWNSIIQDLEKSGVEITYREGSMAYAPGMTDGSPGQLVIDPDASLSALKHEYQHFLDAQTEGFPSFGKQMFEDPKTRVIKELRAYMVEIKEAERLGLKEISEQLFKNYRQEREWIINQYIIPGGE